MMRTASIQQDVTPEQTRSLAALSSDAYADVCNRLVPVVPSYCFWDRVALHQRAPTRWCARQTPVGV
ncbi:hypothetical protein [Candidatus Methylacidithermus pantelleriae]|uniref:Uncharacterized protein n=1 Tax=Candidatus Methylacidithermus pantelleriae TaxID=2744239 RepID=A0A8J2BJ42_9BACT|nr:hypothetical protein [Candidatus Methylacidithermus pantelleriae]CAF0691339.1 hypothetical protein MPNT_100013 [Candidatus Methylacidithermus pantelleriae]